MIESQAGAASNFLDHHYSEQGAQIVYDRETVYKADIIIKIASPTLEEVGYMKPKQILLSSQQPSLLEIDILKALMKKQITALSYEYLQDEGRSEEHTSELQSRENLVCRLLLEKKQ